MFEPTLRCSVRQRSSWVRMTGGCVGAVLLVAGILAAAYAESVKGIKENGVLELSDGKFIRLAGLDVLPEAVQLLPALLGGREIEVRYDKTLKGDVPSVPAAYLFVTLSELELPAEGPSVLREKTVMVNELLLSLGAARVLKEEKFKEKDSFLRAEALARQEGQGIWSYADGCLVDQALTRVSE